MAAHSQVQALPGMAISWRQLGGVAGILGVVLFVIGVLLQGDAPLLDDSAADVRGWYADNGDQYLSGGFLVGLGILFGLLPFFVVLRSVMSEAEGGQAAWSHLTFYAVLIFFTFGAAASTFTGAIAVDADELNDGTVRALQLADFASYGLVMALAPMFLALAMVILKTGVFWTWLAWTSLALAVVAVIGAATPISGDPDGVLALLAWISVIGLGVTVLALSVSLWMSKEQA